MNRGQQWKLFAIIAIAIASAWLVWPPFTIKDKDGAVIQKGKINPIRRRKERARRAGPIKNSSRPLKKVAGLPI